MNNGIEGTPRPEIMQKVSSYGLLMGYINNKLNLVKMFIEHPEVLKTPETIGKAQDWVRDILGHFSFDKSTEFFYIRLIDILGLWPNISREQQLEGLLCLEKILKPFYSELHFYDELRSMRCCKMPEGFLSHEAKTKSSIQ